MKKCLLLTISDIVVSASIEPEAFGRISVEAQAMKNPYWQVITVVLKRL